MPGRRAEALLVEEHRSGVELHVGDAQFGAAAEEPARLADVGGQRAAPLAVQRRRILRGRRTEQ
ncbi:hypothetical protein ABTY53_19995 [Streptomyces noursei]|uniref:hypothetical protein n=1 Tax=Streptomyces noursei TaxID=1971 RepID=UPI00332908A1